MKVLSNNVDFAKNSDGKNQYVSFKLADEIYGVSVNKVQEIIGMTSITSVPNALSYVRGVINLRGAVVPVLDMRSKFKMENRLYDPFTVIIIVEVLDRVVGMIVDTVVDVVDIPTDIVQNASHLSSKIETDFIDGISKVDENLIIILNVEKILSFDEFDKFDSEVTKIELEKHGLK